MHSPCCTCGSTATCTDLATDDVADYTQVSGTWTNDEFDRIVTTDADALLTFNTAHPDGLSVGTFSVRIGLPEDTGQVRVLLAYQDANNYLFLEIDVIDGVAPVGYDLWLGHRTGGVDTYLDGVGVGTASPRTFKICYNGERLGGSYGNVSLDTGIESPLTGSWGDKVGVLVIGLTDGITIEDATFYPINGQGCDGCSPACLYCERSEGDIAIPITPREVQVHFSGVANAACANCVAVFDDMTFLLENVGPDTPDPGGWATRGCHLTAPTTDCVPVGSPSLINLVYGNGGSPSTNWAEVIVNGTTVAGDGYFAFARTTHRCDEVLTATGVNDTNPGLQCDWSACTATLTPNTVD